MPDIDESFGDQFTTAGHDQLDPPRNPESKATEENVSWHLPENPTKSQIKKAIKKLQMFIHYAGMENPMHMGEFREELAELEAKLAEYGEPPPTPSGTMTEAVCANCNGKGCSECEGTGDVPLGTRLEQLDRSGEHHTGKLHSHGHSDLEEIEGAVEADDGTGNYATCSACHRVMNGTGCVGYLEIDGKRYERLGFGENGEGTEDGCPDCYVKEYGAKHHWGCDNETCPSCQGQALGCDCDSFELIVDGTESKATESWTEALDDFLLDMGEALAMGAERPDGRKQKILDALPEPFTLEQLKTVGKSLGINDTDEHWQEAWDNYGFSSHHIQNARKERGANENDDETNREREYEEWADNPNTWCDRCGNDGCDYCKDEGIGIYYKKNKGKEDWQKHLPVGMTIRGYECPICFMSIKFEKEYGGTGKNLYNHLLERHGVDDSEAQDMVQTAKSGVKDDYEKVFKDYESPYTESKANEVLVSWTVDADTVVDGHTPKQGEVSKTFELLVPIYEGKIVANFRNTEPPYEYSFTAEFESERKAREFKDGLPDELSSFGVKGIRLTEADSKSNQNIKNLKLRNQKRQWGRRGESIDVIKSLGVGGDDIDHNPKYHGKSLEELLKIKEEYFGTIGNLDLGDDPDMSDYDDLNWEIGLLQGEYTESLQKFIPQHTEFEEDGTFSCLHCNATFPYNVSPEEIEGHLKDFHDIREGVGDFFKKLSGRGDKTWGSDPITHGDFEIMWNNADVQQRIKWLEDVQGSADGLQNESYDKLPQWVQVQLFYHTGDLDQHEDLLETPSISLERSYDYYSPKKNKPRTKYSSNKAHKMRKGTGELTKDNLLKHIKSEGTYDPEENNTYNTASSIRNKTDRYLQELESEGWIEQKMQSNKLVWVPTRHGSGRTGNIGEGGNGSGRKFHQQWMNDADKIDSIKSDDMTKDKFLKRAKAIEIEYTDEDQYRRMFEQLKDG